MKGFELHAFTYRDAELATCVVQFRALGLIRVSVKQRSVKDTNTYWRLTPYGDHLMTQLLAIKRSSALGASQQPSAESVRIADAVTAEQS